MKKIFLVLILIIIAAGIWFVASDQLSKKKNVGLANPASVFCLNNGGRTDIRTDSNGGQVGFCIFKDNTECDEWAYFRGECKSGEQKNNIEKVNVENYLRENISKLSPVQAVLGGTWYVVSSTIDLGKNSGTVVYEDGHIQETKNFSYTTNEKGEVVSLTIE